MEKQKTNFQKQLDSLIKNLDGKKPSLLLHACCGPCSSFVIEYLAKYFDITILYYNPNIYPEEEYNRRLEELKNLLPRFPEAVKNNVKLTVDSYTPDDFFQALQIKDNPQFKEEAEKGERCRRCYKFRLERAFNYASQNNFDFFCTTLSISPFKDSEKINFLGNELSLVSGNSSSPKWLPSDFKKNGGFKRSLEISQEYGLYRQQYCGCIFSKINTEKAREEYLKNKPQL